MKKAKNSLDEPVVREFPNRSPRCGMLPQVPQCQTTALTRSPLEQLLATGEAHAIDRFSPSRGRPAAGGDRRRCTCLVTILPAGRVRVVAQSRGHQLAPGSKDSPRRRLD
jgi:hypothetical protein